MKKRHLEEEEDRRNSNVFAFSSSASFNIGQYSTPSSNSNYRSPPSTVPTTTPNSKNPLATPSSLIRPQFSATPTLPTYTCDLIRPFLPPQPDIPSSPLSSSQLIELQGGSTLPPVHNLLQQIRSELRSSNNNYSHLIQAVSPLLRRIPAYSEMVDEVIDEKGNSLLLLLCDRPIITIGRYGAGVQFSSSAADSPLIDCVALLLDKGSNVNLSNFDGVTPLLFAIYRNNKPLVDYLLSRGADTESVYYRYGNTALLAACIRRNVVIADALIQAGAKLEAKNWDGNTPFLLACRQEHEAMITFLQTKGANLLAKNLMDQDGAAIIRHDRQLKERVCNMIEDFLVSKVSLEEARRQQAEAEKAQEEERRRQQENAAVNNIARRLEFVDIQEQQNKDDST